MGVHRWALRPEHRQKWGRGPRPTSPDSSTTARCRVAGVYRADWEPAATSGKCMAGVVCYSTWSSFHISWLRYRADWEPAATSGRRVLGVFWRCPAALGGPSTPNPAHFSWKILDVKNWPIFPASCGYVVDLPHVAQVRFWRPKRPHLE